MPVVFGIYHYPTVWVDSMPGTFDQPDLSRMDDRVHDVTFAAGMRLVISREGFFVFDLSNWPKVAAIGAENLAVPGQRHFDALVARRTQQVQLAHAFLACLYSATSSVQNFVLPKMVLAPDDLVSMDGVDFRSMGFGGWSRSSQLLIARLELAGKAAGTIPWHDWRIHQRVVTLSLATITDACARFDYVLSHDVDDSLALADLCLRATSACEEHNYALSLVLAWTVYERLQQRLWSRFLEARSTFEPPADRKRINSKRLAALTNPRDFSASILSEILELAEAIPHEVYLRALEVRRARNDWLHSLRMIDRDRALDAIRLSQDMMLATLGIDLRLSPNLVV